MVKQQEFANILEGMAVTNNDTTGKKRVYAEIDNHSEEDADEVKEEEEPEDTMS